MNVTIIYGTTKKANTYNCVQLFLNNLSLNMNLKITEFFLPKDLPSFNRRCFSCLINGEERRPHSNYFDSIVKSLDDSDLIILASPVFICDISTEMKSFLERLSYQYIKNKITYSMNNKIGLVMSTATGAGLFHTTKTLKRNLNSWGINKTFKFSETLYEMDLGGVSLKTKKRINRKIIKLSDNILDLYSNPCTAKLPIFSKIASSKMESIFENNHCKVTDFRYWKEHSYFHVRN
jgi:multimeric flavodoxin WrbA